jgi:hypothetical protein
MVAAVSAESVVIGIAIVVLIGFMVVSAWREKGRIE